MGGIPLSKGDTVRMHTEQNTTTQYEVAEKTIDCTWKGEDLIADITYILRKR